MATKKEATTWEMSAPHKLYVWTDNRNAVALKAIPGVVQVDWLGNSKYQVEIDPRYDFKELTDEISALD